MSGENGHTTPPAEGAPPAVDAKEEKAADAPADASKEAAAAESKAATEGEGTTEPAPAPAEPSGDNATEETTEKAAAEQTEEKPDIEMTDDAAPTAEPASEAADAAETAASEPADQAGGDAAAADTSKSKAASKRKSIGGGETKGKKLNKKASKPRILHLDAKPGDYFFVKLKGFPQWPVIICDEDMLPASLLRSRPVTAKRADGTYREDYADGGKNVADRTFPVMYLHTNEFGWVPNSELIDLDPAAVQEDVKAGKMKKALHAAHELAAKQHPLSFYKEVLQNYQEELIQKERAKAAKAATPKGKKSKAVEDDEDVEMADAPEPEETPAKDKKAKKRKAEESAETPQRSDSVKKPKIKLTTSSTPKTAQAAASTPKTAKASEPKATKPKAKKADEKKVEKEVAAPKELEISPAERHAKKEKEVLFLRHKLQKGLLTRDQEPKEEEMKIMSDHLARLEGFPDLEVSIIRATKINKVLKAILKLESIPKEEDFQFKPRSQVLLDKWNKLLAVDGTPNPPAAAEGANAVNGTAKAGGKTNGVTEKSEGSESVKAKEAAKEEGSKTEPKEETAEADKEEASREEKSSESTDKAAADKAKAPEAVETSA